MLSLRTRKEHTVSRFFKLPTKKVDAKRYSKDVNNLDIVKLLLHIKMLRFSRKCIHPTGDEKVEQDGQLVTREGDQKSIRKVALCEVHGAPLHTAFVLQVLPLELIFTHLLFDKIKYTINLV